MLFTEARARTGGEIVTAIGLWRSEERDVDRKRKKEKRERGRRSRFRVLFLFLSIGEMINPNLNSA